MDAKYTVENIWHFLTSNHGRDGLIPFFS